MLTYKNKPLLYWCAVLGITRQALQYRLDHGMTLEEACTKPARQPARFTLNGNPATAREVAEATGLHMETVYTRRRRHGTTDYRH